MARVGVMVAALAASSSGCRGTAPGATTAPGESRSVDPLGAATRACDGGDAEACMRVADRYEHGKGVDKDGKRMAAFETKACDLGLAKGCGYLGNTLLSGADGVAADPGRADALWRQACEGGYARSCLLLATTAIGGAERIAFVERACALGDAQGCEIRDSSDEMQRGTALLQGVFSDYEDLVQGCLEDALPDNPSLAGQVTIRFEVDGEGLVTAARSVADETGDGDLVACVVDVYRVMEFPAHAAAVRSSTSPPVVSARHRVRFGGTAQGRPAEASADPP